MKQELELWTICDPADPIPAGAHVHKCANEGCNTYWRHADDIPGVTTEAQFWEAHTCPNCGTQQTWKHASGDPIIGDMDLNDAEFELVMMMLEDMLGIRRPRGEWMR